MTVVFLGAKPGEAVPSLWSCIAGAAEPCRAPLFSPIGVTPVPRRRPRLFALDLSDEGGRAAGLHRAAAGALSAAGLHEPEDRPFWPHVTLARVRRRARSARWAPEDPWGRSFTSRSLTLYQSRPSPTGPRYRVLETLELAG